MVIHLGHLGKCSKTTRFSMKNHHFQHISKLKQSPKNHNRPRVHVTLGFWKFVQSFTTETEMTDNLMGPTSWVGLHLNIEGTSFLGVLRCF